jgi:hypothetical protein
MKKAAIGVGLALALVLGVALWWRRRGVAAPPSPPPAARVAPPPAPVPAPPAMPRNPDFDPAARRRLLGEAKAALLAKIAKDYEEMMNEVAAKFSAEGKTFPGGFPAYLRQLALLERSKWNDYAKALTPRELEDLQLMEHHAGKMVSQYLADSAATDEQKRTVFRLQREFDDKYALIFDLTPASLLAREIERQALQEQVLATLGPNLFAAWARGEGNDYERLADYARKNGIRAEAPLEIWRIKNEFVRRRLELGAQGGSAAAAQALAEQTRARVAALLGPAVLRDPAAHGLNWLPAK